MRSRLLVCLAVAALALDGVHVAVDLGPTFAAWFQPIVFLACGAVVCWRATRPPQRLPWALLGAGLVLYGAGSVYFNLRGGPAFPSAADAMWLAMYPLAFAAMAGLIRRGVWKASAAVWLDGVVAGTVVAALVAAVVFDPVFELTVAGGEASIARLGYPVADLVAVGVVIAVWSVAGRRVDRFWLVLGLGFALLAGADSVYVVQAAQGDWAPGNWLDLPYALATMLLAAAAWRAGTRAPAGTTLVQPQRVGLPVVCGLAALVLTTIEVTSGLNPLAAVLSLMSLLAVVLRLAATLVRLNRQSLALAARAASDPLTGLPNHRTLHERLAAELPRARAFGEPLSVVALDIDHFKAINDTWGHTEGDAALQEIAGALSREVRHGQLVGRVGGEEFVVVLPGLGPDEALAAAERCRAALCALRVHGEAISSSAGVASFPADDPTGSRLLELADGALYWAKRAGRGQTKRYDPRAVVLLSGAQQRAQVQALLDRDDALTPVFQPIVELATGRVAGYEALTRFTVSDPPRTPDLWFAQARRCGLGPALEARALATSLAVPGRPAGTFLTLNVSPAALVSAEVAVVLPDDLSEIVIELTEDEMFSSDSALDAQLAALRERGARIAIDDAGAGYAGLQQLIRVKPEILKLDRSLVSGVYRDASKTALLHALTAFASSTGAAVCGEGVEEVDELNALARADATYAQGYVLGRPGPAWPSVAADVAARTTAVASMGMRVGGMAAAASGSPDAALSLGDVAERLARMRTADELAGVSPLMERLIHADAVAISRVLADERCVETVFDWTGEADRYGYDAYPTTEHVVTAQALGQVIAGDPASDPAELALLAEFGFATVLMAPIVFRGETVGLLEFYRAVARPWTGAEIDSARLLAHSLSAAVQTERGGELPWSPASFGASS